MHQVTVDIDQARAVVAAMDNVRIPDLLIDGAGFARHQAIAFAGADTFVLSSAISALPISRVPAVPPRSRVRMPFSSTDTTAPSIRSATSGAQIGRAHV